MEREARELRDEWRICGNDARRGPWQGTWQATAPKPYDVKQYAARNDEVWVEQRSVWESKPVRVPAPSPEAGE